MKEIDPPRKRCAQVLAIGLGLAAACSASAQSVTVYGLLDAGVEVNKSGAPNEGRRVMLNTGNQSATRLGFRGTEDLGGGLIALFNIEMGFALDTGTVITYGEAAGTFWGRRAVVGLQGAWGELLLGRDYVPGFWTVIQSDRFSYGLPGTVSTPSQITITRINNGIFYRTPNLNGFSGRLAYALGAENSTAPQDLGHFWGASVDYKQGPWLATAAVQNRRDLAPGSTTETANFREAGFGAQYEFDPYVVNVGYWRTDPVTATNDAIDKTRAFWVGGGMKFGVAQVNVQVARTTVDYFGARPDGRATTWGVEYLHFLSKRTNLYAAVGMVRNDDNARLALNTGSQKVGGVVFGADPRAVVVGMRHVF